jgi:hypothetical protein
VEIATVIVLIAVVLLAGALIVIRQSKVGGRFGIGRLRAPCPRCGTRLPMIRRPASTEEAMWGGWTCPSCGCKVDKYGRERTVP